MFWIYMDIVQDKVFFPHIRVISGASCQSILIHEKLFLASNQINSLELPL